MTCKNKNPAAKKLLILFFIDNYIANIRLYALSRPELNFRPQEFFVSTTDGAGIAAVSIFDKEHFNWSIRDHFSSRIFYLSHDFDF